MFAREHQLTARRSTRFIIFDAHAKIICEHQAEFPQILPHAGWHEQDPMQLVECMKECIAKAVEQLEWMGWSKDSVKGIGKLQSCVYSGLVEVIADMSRYHQPA